MRDHELLRFWEACVLAALASGRKTGPEAVAQADLLVQDYAKRRREMPQQQDEEHGVRVREPGA
jgi:hypothetical protein